MDVPDENPNLEKDRLLPIANVSRLMKRALPENAKIAKDAKVGLFPLPLILEDCLQECVSEFISFVTSEASDRCAVDKRKTIGGEDILFALQSLGFDNYHDTLKTYLIKYRENASGANDAALRAFEQQQQQFQRHQTEMMMRQQQQQQQQQPHNRDE
ncbi:transcriptional activator hap3 [Podochytrium sp. JEL0797]|nr:transcriptional activator hap3 [Podochytrium sp. JEL0797]